jgi:hypothetical protein
MWAAEHRNRSGKNHELPVLAESFIAAVNSAHNEP